MCGCIKGTDRLQQLYSPHCKNKIVKITVVYSRSGIAEVNTRRIASLECKLLCVCGFSREAVLTLCIPACLGRKVRETVAVIIDLHLYIELTMPKGKRVKSTLKSIICNVHDYFDWQNKKQKSTLPKLCRGKKTAEATGFSECTVNRVLYWRKESWMEVLLIHQIRDIRKQRTFRCCCL